ncbi:MAG: CO dehydrogenase/CO-methylating acetyl-CoA synthase complex subunit beta [Candidatus Hodarchaeota archaeon]
MEKKQNFECRIKDFTDSIGNMFYVYHRTDIWFRFSIFAYESGFNSLKVWGKMLIASYQREYEKTIEKIQITFFTEENKVNEWHEKATRIYRSRDNQVKSLSDERVDTFFGCALCNYIVLAHFCIITPDSCGLCGSINWFNAKASFELDPSGPIFFIRKEKCIDTIRGEWSGINEIIKARTLGEIERIHLYTILSPFNHTSCHCIEAIAFYMPEVDGIGIVDRNFKGPAINGLPFSTMSSIIRKGTQCEGFVGTAIGHMRSPKFLQADGGWDKIVWTTNQVKDRIKDDIPIEIVNKIATESDSANIMELKDFLILNNHPIVKKWTEEIYNSNLEE